MPAPRRGSARLAALGGGANIYATTWADRAAVRGIVLLVPAVALSEAWQQIQRHDPGHAEQMRDLLTGSSKAQPGEPRTEGFRGRGLTAAVVLVSGWA